MSKLKNNKWYGMSDTFTNTANIVFRLLSVVFIILNYVVLSFTSVLDIGGLIIPLTISSVTAVALILFVEPFTYNKYPVLNFIVNVLLAICCGVLFFSHRTYILIAVFFINVVIVGLRLSIVKCMIISFLYYTDYAIAINYSPGIGVNTILLNCEIFIIFLSTVYICHYFSGIEQKKIKQDEEVIELIDEKVNLVQELKDKNQELEQTYWDMVETLIGVIEARDNFTGSHSVNVCEYSIRLAKKVGLCEEEVKKIMKASILHDIGKMGIPDNILLKPGALSTDEYGTIMNHPEIGYKILAKVKGLEDIIPMILYHHERIDGKGYPFGLRGDKIPVGARIIAIADAYDAMTSNRPYRKALVKREAQKRLLENAGLQFEPEFVSMFIEIMGSDNVDYIRKYRHNEIDIIRKYAGFM